LTLKREWLETKSEGTLPESLQFVRADILKHTVSVRQRQIVAGTEQFRQEGTATIPISEWLTRLLEELKTTGTSVRSAVINAVTKCGYRRPEDMV
jgi:hypothetical protein